MSAGIITIIGSVLAIVAGWLINRYGKQWLERFTISRDKERIRKEKENFIKEHARISDEVGEIDKKKKEWLEDGDFEQ